MLGQIAAAIAKVLELHPDLVILDWTMPVMNGLVAAKAIRSLAPETKILVFSLHSADSVKEEALRAGADAFLHKTAKAGDILETIAGLLAPMKLFVDSSTVSHSENGGRVRAAAKLT